METYTLNVCGLTRKLRKTPVTDELSIASFVMFGDTELVEKCADALAEKIKALGKIDYLVSPEAKGIPLTHAIAVRLNIDYVVIRKSVKAYMTNPLITDVQSITTAKKQQLVMDEPDVRKLDGKRVCIVDDVVSTGGSLKSVETLLSQINCTVAAKVAVLLEEAGYDGKDLIYLERLPIFKTSK
ncbi:MAG: phosphoribosyltransferase family protein [Synergistaceae bacterium]